MHLIIPIAEMQIVTICVSSFPFSELEGENQYVGYISICPRLYIDTRSWVKYICGMRMDSSDHS